MTLYLTFSVRNFQMLIFLAKKLQKHPQIQLILYKGWVTTLQVLALQCLYVFFMFLFKSSCPFSESVDVIFFPLNGPPRQPDNLSQPCDSTAHPAGSSAAAQAVPVGPEISSTQIVVFTVVSNLGYRTDDLLGKNIYKI